MKTIQVIILYILFSSLGCYGVGGNDDRQTFKQGLVKYIQTNCSDDINCSVHLRQISRVQWDELYYFDIQVESDEISNILGLKFSEKSRNYSRKLFLMKDKKIVLYEEYPVKEIDEPFTNGDIDFEFNRQNAKFVYFDTASTFSIEKIALAEGFLYRLRCANCSD